LYLRSKAIAVIIATIAVCQAANAEVKVEGPKGVVPVNAPAFLNVTGAKLGDPFTMFVVPEGGQFIELYTTGGAPVGIYTNSVPGIYTACIVVYNAETKAQEKSTFAIHVGVAPAPVPVPPGPVPPEPQPPTPTPPVVEGKRAVLIIRESADSTPEVARMITGLRNAPHADYLKSKGHTLSILDDDAVDAIGQPSPLVAAWREHFAGMTFPVVFILDPNGPKLIHKESLSATAGADAVMGLLKKHGG
jgi:hypothetical protein